MRTIGLFGGSFDPPHVAHLAAARHALVHHGLDELWFVPVYVHPRGKRLARYADRVAMLELAAASLGSRVRVSRIERTLGPCTTFDVIERLDSQFRDVRWRLVIGADLARTMTQWRCGVEVICRAPPIVIARGTPNISATQVRAALDNGALDIAAARLPPAVLRYITSRGLYGSQAAESLRPQGDIAGERAVDDLDDPRAIPRQAAAER